MAFPRVPDNLRATMKAIGLEPMHQYLSQSLADFMSNRLDTRGDVTMTTAGKGIVMMNKAGTIIKRVRLNDAGTGFIIEDV